MSSPVTIEVGDRFFEFKPATMSIQPGHSGHPSGQALCPSLDNIWAIMIVWRRRGKIVTTVLYSIMYTSSVQWYAHIYEQFLQLTVGLGLFLISYLLFVYFSVCFN